MSEGQHHGSDRLSRFSLDRRITVFVLMTSAVVVGTIAALSLPIELIPKGYQEPFLSVYIPWRDSPPREVLDKLTEPLEAELSTVKGVSQVVSVSNTGSSRVFLTFKQKTDMDVAYREVRDRVERARREFPADVDKVYIRKDDVSGIPVSVIGVAVDPSVGDSYNLVEKHILMPIERIDGVASVEANGLEEKEILIELDRNRTEASGLNIYDLAQELGGDSFTMASGHVFDSNKKLLLRSVARYASLEELENRLVDPSGIRLKDVATISYAEPDKRYRVRAMSKPAYAIIVFKEGEANATDVSERVDEVFEDLQADPNLAQAELIMLWSQGDTIKESLTTLLSSGLQGAILSALVLFFFLRRVRVTTVVSMSVPLSLIIALMVMAFAGETLNILTLLALMVSVGMLVDNSVVVAENIDRMSKLGLSKREAAISGASEIALAITMSTLTTVVVFVPVALVEGPGQFFLQRMAIPISVALLASLLVALVYVPLTVYLTLPTNREVAARERVGTPWGRFITFTTAAYENSFGRMNRSYNRILGVAVRRRLELVLVLLLVFAGTIGLMRATELKFVDVQENEQAGFEVDVTMPDNFTLEETEKWFLEAEKVVEAHAPEFGLEGWFLFHAKTRGELQGWFTTPRSSDLSAREVTEKVVKLLPKQPGMEISTGQDRSLDADEGKGMYRVVIQGENHELLASIGKELERFFVAVPGVVGIRRNDEETPNELGLVIDRERAESSNVNPQVIAGLIGYALRGQALPKYHADGREIPVRVRFAEEDRDSLDELSSFMLPSNDGSLVPVSALVEPRVLRTPDRIIRRDKRISHSITLDLVEGEEDEARKRLDTLRANIDLPEGISFEGQERRGGMDEDLKPLILALWLSIVFIYLLMGILFESFWLPWSILFTIPLAGLGVIWIHLMLGLDIDFLGAVGIVILVGVVVNNGIVLVDYINRLRLQGVERGQALLLATERRFRPIMMTAITTVGGMVPLAINGRMDSGISYTSFALTLIGGMTTATLLTLLVVPVFYTLVDDFRVWLSGMTRFLHLSRSRRGAVSISGAATVAPPDAA